MAASNLKPAPKHAELPVEKLRWRCETSRVPFETTAQAEPRGNEDDKQKRGSILLFVGPAVLIYTAFVIIPSLRAFAWSVHSWDGQSEIGKMPFVGSLNFRRRHRLD